MPLPKRVIEPVYVSRGTLLTDQLSLPSELEAVTNGTLANTVRQLSSLSRHAEDLFGELAREARLLASRASNLQARIDRLAVKVTQLDSNVEEVSLQDIHMRKAFRSSVVFDQQVVSRSTMPAAMLETYQTCDKPPPLDKLNPYREDGKDGLRFYTDPNYFFDLWRQEMLKDTDKKEKDRGKKPHRPKAESGVGRHKKRVRQPHNTRERQKQMAVYHGEYIMPQTGNYHTPQQPLQPDEALLGAPEMRPPRPNSIELRRSYPDTPTGLYSPRHVQSPSDANPYRANYPVQVYDEYPLQYVPQDPYQTPGRVSLASRTTSQRPSQPPPAPPSNSNSNNSTPTMGSANNTPTRARSLSTGRETLPPPPPPPGEGSVTTNGGGVVPAHIPTMQQQRGSPPISVLSNHSTPTHIIHHPSPLSTAVNNGVKQSPFHNSPVQHFSPNHHPTQPVNSQVYPSHIDIMPNQNSVDSSDLPPPPPTPDQHHHDSNSGLPPSPPPPPVERSPSPSGPAPPPPPPPPPLPVSLPNGPVFTPPTIPLVNGDVGKMTPKQQILSSSPPKQTVISGNARKTANATEDPGCEARSNLLKAIQEGIKLRKVEKISQKEVERSTAPHDVASILARRLAMEFSDSESGGSESEEDSEGWEDETSA